MRQQCTELRHDRSELIVTTSLPAIDYGQEDAEGEDCSEGFRPVPSAFWRPLTVMR